MEENHISESGGELILNDGSGEEGEVREGSREIEHVLPISLTHDTVGLRPNKSVRILEVRIGGPDKLGCLPRDCRNYVQKLRRLNIGAGDADCINRIFIKMHQKNSNFFHLMLMDEEAYEEFNDVVCVDSTYLLNRYNMPFVTIVEVNHHGQCTFTWLAIIGGQAPAIIMTDQCESMGNAIKEVMSIKIRRCCIWHNNVQASE
ncbi:hypothetical protein M9H77_31302 [Catharanthus roseus]|uniref:Uncharacterized protein n=1 Tax=Catharanthus roseus TaxID=4058 RepID=A0ACB9ZZP3_CATRO|nr:hypothetical protein M9H77_31302 [Catharanthus roseus]